MNISDFKFTIFDIIGYVVPGVFFVIFLGFILFGYNMQSFKDNILTVLLLSYPAGQILHALSEYLDKTPTDIGWAVYHFLKEKDDKGKGVENPEKITGMFALWLRKKIEVEKVKKTKDIVTEKIKEKYSEYEIDNFDVHFIKEVLLAKDNSSANSFEYLHYQKIFNKSFATLAGISFLYFTIWFHFISYPYLRTGYLPINCWLTISFILCLIPFYLIFTSRSNFFDEYRRKIIRSVMIIQLNKK